MKKIAIPVWKIGPNSVGVTIPYLTFAERYGQVKPIHFMGVNNPTKRNVGDFIEEEMEDIDLLILPGGADVSPSTYNKMPWYTTSYSDPIKEAFDKFFLPYIINANIPILGICRGHQVIGAMYGMDILQEIGDEHPTNEANKRGDRVHGLVFTPAGLDFLGIRKGIKVNSMHHQGIETEEVEKCTDATLLASSDKDNISEIIKYEDHPIVTVQYHPEALIGDPISKKIMNYLLFI